MGKWEKTLLGDVCQINPYLDTELSNDVYYSVIPMDAVSTNGDILYKRKAKRDEISAGLTQFRNGDILFAKITPCMENGKCAIASELDNGVGFGSTEFHVLRPSNKVEKRWLFHLVHSSEFRAEAQRNMTGSAGQKRVPTSFLRRYEILLPPLPIQQKIADALDKATALIEMRKAQIEKLDLLIKSQFIEMFGDPVTNPLGLMAHTLSVLALIKAGRNETSDNIHEFSSEFSYPCFGGNGIRGYVREYTYEGDYPLIGRQGALCGNVQFASGRFFPTEHALVVSPIVDYESKWMYFTLKYLNLNRFQTGAAQPGLNVDIINKIVIPTPSREEQKLFANFLMLVEKQRRSIEDSLRVLELNFRSLMQKCFSGEMF